jgi:hypothetical protein
VVTRWPQRSLRLVRRREGPSSGHGTDEDDLIQTYLETRSMSSWTGWSVDDRQLVLAMFAEWDEDTTPGGDQGGGADADAPSSIGSAATKSAFRVADNGRLSKRVESYLGSWLERPIA